MSTAGYDFAVPHVAAAVEEIEDTFGLVGMTYKGHGGADDGGMEYSADFWTLDKAKHDAVLAWFIASHKRIGGKYIITWKRIFSDERSDEGVREYTRYDPPPNTQSEDHYNHVHITFTIDPPPPAPPVSQLGVPLMANAEEIWINYHDDQLLRSGGPGNVKISDAAASIVIGESTGIECSAVIEFEGLLPGEFAHIFWRRVWKKTGAVDVIKPPTYLARPAVPLDANTWSAMAFFGHQLPKADAGWTACLRLMYLTNSATAKITRRQFQGWYLT
jgi:hypothetical protein